MHILLISRCPPYPLHLGDRLIIYHLVRQLKRRGHTIDLIAFTQSPDDRDDLPHYADDYGTVTLLPEPPRSQVSYLLRLLYPPGRFPRQARASWSPEMWAHIRTALSQTRYDVVHLFGGVQVYEYRHAIGDLPTVITPYESYTLYLKRAIETTRRRVDRRLTRTGASQWLQWHSARTFERFMFAPFDRVVVVSPPDRDELLAINPALKVTVISNGIDLDYFHPADQPRAAAQLLFVGNYDYEPNRDAALHLARDLFPQIKAQHPDAALWLVGNAPPPELMALRGGGIDVTGRVPDVRPYLATATAFVCPLRLGAGIKNKVLEALAVGCPVVATPLSVDGIDVEDGESVLLADDDSLVAATSRLLRDADLQRRLSANGVQLIRERYSWAGVAAQYEQLYDETRSAQVEAKQRRG